MDVLITGGAGTVGTAITDHLADRETVSFRCLDREPHPNDAVTSTVGDAGDFETLRSELEGVDALIHLANVGLEVGGPWERTIQWTDAHGANLSMHATVMAAAVDAGVETVVWASSNHAVGMYEVQHAPGIYQFGADIEVDHTVQPRPDSMYGIEKLYGEGLGRLAADAHDIQVYALRICAVRDPAYDHPYGDAERGVDRGDWEHGSDAYAEQVARLKAMWQSRRDLAHLVECCLRDSTVTFDVFYGVSANERRWFDIDHAREVLGYEPVDNGEDWDAPPA